MDQSFGPSRRVKKRQDFLRIQSSGRKVRSQHFLLIFSLRQTEQMASAESRLGVTITKKIDKRAARRNRLRRRVREVFRRKRAELKKPVDLVFIALSESTELNYEQIGRELSGLLRKARLV